MAYVLPELLLAIADYADSQSIYSLMLTCRCFRDVLQYHERSVVKARLDAYCRSAVDPRVLRDPALASQHPLLRLDGDTHGTVLTSHSPRRTVARPYSYAVVRELEVREQRNRELFGCTPSNIRRAGIEYENTTGGGGGGVAPSSSETAQRMSSLVRACRVADLIGDSVARVVARAGWVDGYNAHLAADHHCPFPSSSSSSSSSSSASPPLSYRCPCNAWNSTLAGSPLLEDAFAGTGGISSSSNRDNSISSAPGAPRTPMPTPADCGSSSFDTATAMTMTRLARAVRESQLAVVRALSQWDLVHLSWLTEVAGASYSQSVPQAAALSDPAHLEKRTAFQECVLRRGATLSMWAFCDPEEGEEADEWLRAACKRRVDDAVRVVLGELFLWEMGHGADRVPLGQAFPPVEDPALEALAEAFDRAAGGGGQLHGLSEGVQQGTENDEEEEVSIPVMQPGLQMTTVRTLLKKADPAALQDHEKRYVRFMTPYDGASGQDWDEEDSLAD